MVKTLITQQFLDEFRCPPGKSKVEAFDTLLPGFTFERRPSGKGTFSVRYFVAGRQRQLKVCCEGEAPLARIRKKAHLLRSEAALGGDPAAQKAAIKAVPLYRDLAIQHLADAKLHQRSYSTTEMYMRCHILPRWGKVRLTDIGSRAVAHWEAEKLAEGLAPATVVKMSSILGRSFELGARWGIPGTEKNPTRGIARKPLNNARERFLSAEEAARLREAVAASQNPQLRHIVGLLLLTGARVRELLDARWEHVDVERRTWLIPTSKTGKPRHVPLSKAALEIIEALPRFKDCPFLVPNPDTLKPFVSIKHSWQRAIKVAKLPGLRIHDLRHSAASFMVNSGVDLFAVGKVLGHASYQSTQRYAHLANDTLLAAVEAGAAKQAAA